MKAKHGEFKLSSTASVIDKDGNVKQTTTFENDDIVNEVEMIKRDKQGEVLETKRFPMKSFVYQWAKMIYSTMGYQSTGIRDAESGTTYTGVKRSYRADCNYDSDDYGIQVGSDDGSFLPLATDNYKMGTKLCNGRDANELVYHETYVRPPRLSGDEYILELSRVFTNESPGALTIKEIGLYIQSVGYNLMIRDIEDADGNSINLTLSVDESVEIKYYIKITTGSGFNKNFIDALYYMMYCNRYYGEGTENTDEGTFTDTTGNVVDFENSYYAIQCNATLHQGDYGLVVGSGSSAVTYDQHKLDAPILHGTTAGTLKYEYTESLVHADPDDSDKYHVHLQRAYVNEGGSDVTVTEAGIYGVGESSNRVMAMRALYPSGIVVSDTESLRVNFVISMGL